MQPHSFSIPESLRSPDTKPTKYGRCPQCNYALSASGECRQGYRLWRRTHCACGAEFVEDAYQCSECGLVEDECFCDMEGF